MDLIIFGIILSSWGLGQLIETSLIFVASYGKGNLVVENFRHKSFDFNVLRNTENQ